MHGLPGWAGGLGEDVFAPVADDFDAYLDALVLHEETAQDLWEDALDAAGAEPGDPWRLSVEAWLDSGMPDWRARPWAVA